MFGFFNRTERKMREYAANWLHLADKITPYRRDEVTEAQLQELNEQRAALRLQLKQRADAGRLKLGIESLEGVLRQVGGNFYPKSWMMENVEFFLAAAIIVLGLRTYFIQPFKIPTNSMWPSYYGLTGENYPPGDKPPGLLDEIYRFVAFGSQRREAVAPVSGEVAATFFPDGQLAYTVRTGLKWLVIPAKVRRYTFYVGGASTSVDVPYEFHDFDRLFRDTFFGGNAGFNRFLEQAGHSGEVEPTQVQVAEGSPETTPAYMIKLGRRVKAGTPIMRFDVLTGDCLFVDRFSYNFVRPKVGDGFVFRTNHIPAIGQDEYYIKRLVGEPGDRLQIRQPVLYRNGKPITGARAFTLNNHQEDRYPGYRNAAPGDTAQIYLRRPDDVVVVPPRSYFALGDNSANSEDGRYWGFVPEKSVVGRPLFIYYPFSRRWGLAH